MKAIKVKWDRLVKWFKHSKCFKHVRGIGLILLLIGGIGSSYYVGYERGTHKNTTEFVNFANYIGKAAYGEGLKVGYNYGLQEGYVIGFKDCEKKSRIYKITY